MSYAQEPYAQFVSDLVMGMTGGMVRRTFAFAGEPGPYDLAPPGPILPSSVQVFGQRAATFTSFRRDVDYTLDAQAALAWKARADGTPAADANWPDRGTPFYVNYDHASAGGRDALLTDRNPGSVLRVLAESFAREFAVVSKQLEAVYQAGFVTTASGRDLDQLAALVGVTRRDQTFAFGAVVFSRATPAQADVFVPAGTRVSTSDAPSVVFETAERATLQRGGLSVEVTIRAVGSGRRGVVAAHAIDAIHRPILGIDAVTNPQGTQLSGDDETDGELRGRIQRALPVAGRATTGALVGAIATVPGVREKDVLLEEDYLTRPGMLVVSIARELDHDACVRALELIERHRPAGVRVVHRLDCDDPPGALPAGANEVADDGGEFADDLQAAATIYRPVAIRAILVPASAALAAAERAAMKQDGEATIRAAVDDAGVGEPLIYNRLVRDLMQRSGVQDVALELFPIDQPGAPRHRNLFPGKTRRSSVAAKQGGSLEVRVAGELISLDVTVTLVLKGAGLLGDALANQEAARAQVATDLRDQVSSLAQISVAALRGLIAGSETFDVTALHYRAEYVSAGVRIKQLDPTLEVSAEEAPWIRAVTLAEAPA